MKKNNLILAFVTTLILSMVGCRFQFVPSVEPSSSPSVTPTEGSAQPTEGSKLFKFISTVRVTPDDNSLAGGFIRIGYVPATNHFAVAYGTPKLAHPSGGCQDGAHVYKEYTLDMQPAGSSGVLNCGGGDSAELFFDNVLYDVSVRPVNGSHGWHIEKFDAATWKKLGELDYALDEPQEGSGDMMIEYVNGVLDISSGYTTYGGPSPMDVGASTHHKFFTPDLKFLDQKILSDTPHITGSSMIYVDGTYYFIAGTAFTGGVIMMQYDKDWKYLGMKELRKQAHFSEGVAFDGQRFYISYLDTSQRTNPGFWPFYPNVHLAAFDRNWNLVEDVAVTNYTAADNVTTGRPWLLLHGNHLYVAYDMTQRDVNNKNLDILDTIQAYVAVYELTGK